MIKFIFNVFPIILKFYISQLLFLKLNLTNVTKILEVFSNKRSLGQDVFVLGYQKSFKYARYLCLERT